jgi:hypothetical protein
MDRRRFLLTALADGLAGPFGAEAQRAGRVAHIGYLLLPPLSEKPSAERQAFRISSSAARQSGFH